jgi:hypothetical protein
MKIFPSWSESVTFDAKLKLFPGKLKSKWTGSFLVRQVFGNRATEISELSHESEPFFVNG